MREGDEKAWFTFREFYKPLIATRGTYGGEIVPKEPHLADCAFTSGLVRRPDGLWDLYSGLCDSAEGRVTLLFDPFAPIS